MQKNHILVYSYVEAEKVYFKEIKRMIAGTMGLKAAQSWEVG